MGLSASLSIAQSALATAAAQSSILSRNISNVNTPNYSRKSPNVVTTSNGSSTVSSVQRATDTALLGNVLQAQSDSAAQSAISAGLTQIQNSLGLTGSATSLTNAASATDQSPSTMIANFSDALQAYAAGSDTSSNGTAAVAAAVSLAQTLNSASATVQTIRAQADSQIATSVQTVNSLLTQFQSVNQEIVKGTATGADISDAQDTRDSILSQLSSQIGITTSGTADGGMTIATDSGVMLFDQTARTLSFTPTTTFTAGTVGNSVSVDGIAITNSTMAVKSGALAGLTQLRDTTTTTYQAQLDNMAGTLISTFAENDSSSSPTLAGLFTNGGSPSAVLASVVGLASSISVNASVDPSQGGSVTRLRDGNISDPTSAGSNSTGAAAYSAHLDQLVSALGSAQVPASGSLVGNTLSNYASSSVGWVSGSYQAASNAASYQTSVVSTATSALSNSTGVNLDDQMSQMLDIEHAYQASAQLLNTVGSMYTSLITAMN